MYAYKVDVLFFSAFHTACKLPHGIMTAKLVSYNPSNSEVESWKGGVQLRHFPALKPSSDAGYEDSNVWNKIPSPGPSTVNAYNSIFDLKKKIRVINWNSQYLDSDSGITIF